MVCFQSWAFLDILFFSSLFIFTLSFHLWSHWYSSRSLFISHGSIFHDLVWLENTSTHCDDGPHHHQQNIMILTSPASLNTSASSLSSSSSSSSSSSLCLLRLGRECHLLHQYHLSWRHPMGTKSHRKRSLLISSCACLSSMLLMLPETRHRLLSVTHRWCCYRACSSSSQLSTLCIANQHSSPRTQLLLIELAICPHRGPSCLGVGMRCWSELLVQVRPENWGARVVWAFGLCCHSYTKFLHNNFCIIRRQWVWSMLFFPGRPALSWHDLPRSSAEVATC